jgi:hypothetical protein
MSDIQRLTLEDDEGNAYAIFFEAPDGVDLPDAAASGGSDDDYEAMGITDDVKAKLKDIHGTLQAYAWYALGAFHQVPFAEVTEMTLKFGIKIGGKTGIPVLTEGSAEGNFQIEVKCKPKA